MIYLEINIHTLKWISYNNGMLQWGIHNEDGYKYFIRLFMYLVLIQRNNIIADDNIRDVTLCRLSCLITV